MKKILLLLFPLFCFAQTQYGPDIYPEGEHEGAGWYVSLSNDGQTIAIGGLPLDDENNGFSRAWIYNFNGVDWIQKGPTLEITEFDSGIFPRCRVALSADGDVIAIATTDYGTAPYRGIAKVYQFSGTTWQQKGQDIIGDAGDKIGFTISISGDGNRLAVIASGTGGSDNRGNVTVYEFNGSQWQQLGQRISGQNDMPYFSFNQGAVSLSTDGNTMAVGLFDAWNEGNIGGQVRIYEYNNLSWQLKGQIIGNSDDDVENFGWDVSLSADGNFVAAGAVSNDAPGTAKVYQFNDNQWQQKGQDIPGISNGDFFGNSVSISSNGEVLAVGAPFASGGGAVQLYKYENSAWIQAGTTINPLDNTNVGFDVSLTPSADFLAIGAPSFPYSGLTRIYALQNILSSDKFVQSQFLVFPNPAEEYVTVGVGSLTAQRVNIYSTSGQLIRKSNNIYINVSDMSAGTYFIEVITNEGKATKTFIKQ